MPRMVEIERLGKRYRLGEDFARYLTLRETLANRLRRRGPARGASELWALRDVSLALDDGEVLGVVGRNGAGKSTLLKLVARITEPTSGLVRTRGRVGALLEVGTGFHPELTGRENVFLNGAILGLSKREIIRRFDEIVEFAGVERFLDTPLKRYSTGMNLRLAFAVAAHVEPPIVVVDEVLAVGDAEFQQKCLGKMSELRSAGRTVMFVSHNLGAISQLCSRAIWLDRGAVEADGEPAAVVEEYLAAGLPTGASIEFAPRGQGTVELVSVTVTDETGAPLGMPRRDEPFALRVRFVSHERLPHLNLAIYLLDRHGVHVLDHSWSEAGRPTPARGAAGEYEASLTVPPVLAAGEYVAGVWIGTSIGDEGDTFVHQDVLAFRLWPRPDDRQESPERQRIVHTDVEWSLVARSVEEAPSRS